MDHRPKDSCAKDRSAQNCLENIKLIAASAAGIGALICSALPILRCFGEDLRNVRPSVKRRGKGYSAVYISADSSGREKYCAAAFLFTAAAGCFAAAVYADEKRNGRPVS